LRVADQGGGRGRLRQVPSVPLPTPHSCPTDRRRLSRTRTSAVAACLGLAVLAAGATPAAPRVLWMWTGAVTTSSATIKARVVPPGTEARLVLSREPDLVQPDVRLAATARGGIATFTPAGLAPGTRYFYAVEAGGHRSAVGRFRTFLAGPMSFRLAAASCASTGSRSGVFLAIDRLEPDMFIHMGDLHYENIAQPLVSRFLRAYDDVFSSGPQAALYRHVPIAYVWDDHDYGPNDSDRTSPSRAASQAAYRAAVPHYPLASDGPIHQAFTIGRVRIILTDVRSERSPVRDRDDGGKTLLGQEQRAWLLEQLADASSFPLVVWVNTVPWITREGSASDGWQPYARERTVIANAIARLGLARRLVMLSGDAHMAAIDDGTHSNYSTEQPAERGFVVLHAAPLDRRTSRKGGPYSHGVSRHRGQFGVVDVEDDGTTLRVQISARDAQGAPIQGLTLGLTCDGATCRPGKPAGVP
jgi:phosphodiesterase/alkaline phosphatase D-like protein